MQNNNFIDHGFIHNDRIKVNHEVELSNLNEGINQFNEFFFDPRLNIIKIAIELITINKLAFVKDISISPNFISGPILLTSNWCIGFAIIFYFCIFFADLTTFKIPAITPTKKNININHGLVPKVLSKINPIIVPTATAETNSVLSLKALPIGDGLCFLSSRFLFETFFFAISKRVLKGSLTITII